MFDEPERESALEMRASDTDRERVADRLRDAAANGRITMAELEERLELAYGAKTYAELKPITRDLPTAGMTTPTRAMVSSSRRIGGTPTGSWAVAVMSGCVRRGKWVVPARLKSFAFWGGVVLDLRNATFAEPGTVIYAHALMGGVEIIVPEDVELHVDGVGIMGGYDYAPVGRPPVGAPVVRVTGIAFWGGVSVKVKRADELDGRRRGELGG